jgi:hypothetical protein
MQFLLTTTQNSPRFATQRPNKPSQLDSFLCPHAMAIFPICSPSNTPPREVICNDDQDVIQRAASNRGGGDGTDDVAKPEPMSVV